MKKVKFKITGMHCVSCAMNIDGELEDTDGILESNTTYVKEETEVSYDHGKIAESKIVEIIEKVGYNATKIGEQK